jgi:uncharacterized protein YqeY
VASELKDQITQGVKDSMKSGDKVRLSALRMLFTAVTVREKEVLHDLSDDEVREVAQREAKKRRDSIEAFEAGNRQELADRERAELDVLQPFLPEMLSDAEVDAIVERAIDETGATSVKEMGKVMNRVMAEAKGKVDGSVVQQKVKRRLSE